MNRYLGTGVLLCLCLLVACNNEQRLFYKLQEARREADRARPLAEELSRTSKGTELALANMDVFGGTTRGWSSWILMETRLAKEVEPQLNELIADQSAEPAKRVEASYIMWNRTKDSAYLQKMFEMVRLPGDPAVEWGRRKLATSINPEDVTKQLTVPASEPIALSVDEFHFIIQNRQNLRIPNDRS